MALEAYAYQMSQVLSKGLSVQAKPTEGHTIAVVAAAWPAEIDRLAADGPTDAELERISNSIEVSFLQELEDLHSRASALNQYRYLKGDPGWVRQDLERYRAVTAEDVKAAAALLRVDRRGLLRVRPETEEEPTAPEGGE